MRIGSNLKVMEAHCLLHIKWKLSLLIEFALYLKCLVLRMRIKYNEKRYYI